MMKIIVFVSAGLLGLAVYRLIDEHMSWGHWVVCYYDDQGILRISAQGDTKDIAMCRARPEREMVEQFGPFHLRVYRLHRKELVLLYSDSIGDMK